MTPTYTTLCCSKYGIPGLNDTCAIDEIYDECMKSKVDHLELSQEPNLLTRKRAEA